MIQPLVGAMGTSMPELVLLPFCPEDGKRYIELLEQNREHLSRFGDYSEVLGLSSDEICEGLVAETGRDLRCGVYFSDALVGRVDLNRLPSSFSSYLLGYWIDARHCGRGFGFASCEALIRHATLYRGAQEIWADVSPDNKASLSVLGKLGFCTAERTETRIRLRLSMIED